MNLQSLLIPLTHGPSGCGEDMAFSAEVDQIQEARRADDPSLSQGDWVTDLKEANWVEVTRIAETVLTQRSKDLRVASWLTEAECKLHGLPGLSAGFQLIADLCENFWGNLYPSIEDGDLDERVGVLDWLLMQSERLIRNTPITQSSKGVFSLIDYEHALATSRQQESLENRTGVSSEQFEAAVRSTKPDFFTTSIAQVDATLASLQNLQNILDPKLGDQAPTFRACREALTNLRHFFGRHTSVAPSTTNPTDARSASPATLNLNEQIQPMHTAEIINAGVIRTRADAMARLEEVAAFFRTTEPHSPVAYLAEKAIKWGAMPLHEWLRAVLKDDGSLLRVEELLGVEARDQNYSE